MKIFIFGGNRFMGKKLVEELVELKLDVTIFNRSGTGPSGVSIIQGDRNNIEDIKQINLKEYDYIFDMCLFKPDQYKLIEEELIESNNKKYIFISSASVGNKDFGDYALEKEQVEELIKKSNLNYTIIRPVYVVGEGSHRPRLGYFINKIIKEQPISIEGGGDNLINLIHVDDVIELLMASMFTYNKKTIIASNGQNISVNNIIQKISNFLDIKNFTTTNGTDSPFMDSEFVFNKTQDDFKELEDMLPNYYKWLKIKGNKKYEY